MAEIPRVLGTTPEGKIIMGYAESVSVWGVRGTDGRLLLEASEDWQEGRVRVFMRGDREEAAEEVQDHGGEVVPLRYCPERWEVV